MAKIKDRAAREKIIAARTSLLVSNGFFGFLAMHLGLVEDYTQPTAWVDGKNMGYNPDFVHQLDEAELEFLVAHEVMHCCFQHFGRRGNRDPRAWNVAGDFVINLDLQESGFKLINNRPINGKNFQCCIDTKYKGMTTEEIYDTFPVVYIGSLGAGGDDPGGCGGVRDAPGNSVAVDDTKHNWEVTVRTAVQVAAANNAGHIPGTLRNLIDALNAPKVSWRDLTKRFIDQSMTKDISWSRINRRSMALGTLMPGYISDRLQKLVCFVDTSGSTQAMVGEMLGEVGGALDQGTADIVVVVYADTDVQHVDEFYQGDRVVDGKYSGGGTAFSNSFKWLAENHPDASCVIYLTDLIVYDFGEEPPCPLLWAVYGPSANFPRLVEAAPFGMAIHVSEGD